jgi:hypothetical protein
MKVFISWSGELSRELGKALRDWVPSVLQAVKPFFSPNDTEKGGKWSKEIGEQLEETSIGVFCLTRESLMSHWIAFEAGAISKVVEDSHVCPILFGLNPADVSGPLAQFQFTQFTKDDMHQFICTINEQCSESALTDSVRDSSFEKWWPDLETKVKSLIENHKNHTFKDVRTQKEILEEILSVVRMLARQDTPSALQIAELSALNDKHLQDLRTFQLKLTDTIADAQHSALMPIQTLQCVVQSLISAIKGKDKVGVLNAVRSLKKECDKAEESITATLPVSQVSEYYDPVTKDFIIPCSISRPTAERLDLVRMIQDIHAELALLREDRTIRLKEPTLIGECDPCIYSAEETVRTILLNLIQNALKYSLSRTFIGTRYENAGERIDIRIQNFGIPIPKGQGKGKERWDRIFDLGYRAPKAKEIDVTGSGSGLFLVRGLVRKLGGIVEVYSSKPSKTADGRDCYENTFRLLLPRRSNP